MKSLKTINWAYVIIGFAVTFAAAIAVQMLTKTETVGYTDEEGETYTESKTVISLPFMSEEAA
jgi:hypothetical protein